MSRADEIRAERKERGIEVLAGRRMRLSVNKALLEPGWEHRWTSDDGSNIFDRQQMGWEIVQDRAGTIKRDAKSLGAEVSTIAGTQDNGAALRQVLMRIPAEIYNEDQRTKQAAIDAKEASIQSGAVSGAGKGEMYTPSEMKITHGGR